MSEKLSENDKRIAKQYFDVDLDKDKDFFIP